MRAAHRIGRVVFGMALLGAQHLWAEDTAPAATGAPVNFVACPILRTTNIPCWVAQFRGELYYIGVQDTTASVLHPPQLNHQALVEGVMADTPRVCGGIVLDHLRVSVLPEVDHSCNAIIPAEGYADPPHRRGVGPAEHQQPERPPPAIPGPPHRPQEFVVKFDFDLDHPWIIEDRTIEAAMLYAKASGATKVEVMGYRGLSNLSDGRRFDEESDMAQRRAANIAEALQVIGVNKSIIAVSWKRAPAGPNPDDRRVVIRVTPGAAPVQASATARNP
jgi:hypothetical protein